MTDDTTPNDATNDERADGDVPADVVERLSAAVTPLETTDPEAPLADLVPLRRQFEGTEVVGLGEATHGTREFFRLKHRLFRFLVEELDYRLFGLEANFTETLAVDEYVRAGEGDPREALAGVYFWTWNTEAVLALIEWLRKFNDGRPEDDRVRFYGIDAQFTAGSAEALVAYLRSADPDLLDGVREELRSLEAEELEVYGTDADEAEPLERFERIEPVVGTLREQFRRREGGYAATTSTREYELASRHFRTLEQALDGSRLFVDLDAVAGDDRLAGWFDRERALRSVGARYYGEGETGAHHDRYRLPAAFDGLIFVDEGSRARPLDD